jgi:hypothetical protein
MEVKHYALFAAKPKWRCRMVPEWVAARGLYLNHVCAKVTEDDGGNAPREASCEVQHPYSV